MRHSRDVSIIITGVEDPMVLEDVTRLGADDSIVKPFSINQIEATIIKHITKMF